MKINAYLESKGYTVIDLDNLGAGYIQKYNMPYTYNHEKDKVVLDDDFILWADEQMQLGQGAVRIDNHKIAILDDVDYLGSKFIDVRFCLLDGRTAVTAFDYESENRVIFVKKFNADGGMWVDLNRISFL